VTSGRWARDWLVQFRVTSDKWSRRLFGSEKAAHIFAGRVTDAGGSAVVRDLAAERRAAMAERSETAATG
jgi:hypothetical protein